MKTNYLLPHKYKNLGWILFLGGILLGIFLQVFNFGEDPLIDFYFISDFGFDYLDEIISILIILGGLLVGFTKEKTEDEFIYKLRNDSLVWAIILNYSILLITVIFIYEMNFFTVLVYNMFTPLIFFIIRFNFLKLKSGNYEE
jgi:hypothetical protein